MSFSRWSNSIWYTYNSSSLDNHKRNEQVFTICMVSSFTYKELKEDIELCLNLACHKEQLVYPWVEEGPFGGYVDEMAQPTFNESLKPTPEEREELKGYMLKFIYRVEKDKELED